MKHILSFLIIPDAVMPQPQSPESSVNSLSSSPFLSSEKRKPRFSLCRLVNPFELIIKKVNPFEFQLVPQF